jgi:hypothetical protein
MEEDEEVPRSAVKDAVQRTTDMAAKLSKTAFDL